MNEQGPFDRILRQEPSRDRGNRLVIVAIVVLGLLLLILVLPPISILSGGGGGEGSVNISVKARKESPAPPEGMEALSPLYDVSVSGSVEGPTQITLALPSTTSDPRNLSLYTLDGNQWRRIGSAKLIFDGAAVQGEVSVLPKNIAVLRATSALHQLSGSLPAGRELNPQAAEALSVLNPVDFAPAFDGSLVGEPAALPEDIVIDIYPTIRVTTAQQTEAANAIIGSPDLRNEHLNAILEMVESSSRYRGVDLDYGPLDALHKDEFSQFVVDLAEQLHRRGLGLTLTAPLPVQQGADWDSGAYDWLRLAQAADAIKLLPEEDPSRYYKRMEDALSFLIEQEKLPPAKLVLVLGPWAHEKGGEGIRRLSLLEALTIASTLKLEDEGAIPPGDSVTIIGESIYKQDGASGIGWDEEAAAVSFSYPGLGGARTIWIENSFSFVFRLDLATRFHLGGLAVEDVSTDPGVNDIWPVLQEFAATGKASLVKPNGTLLLPYWEADGGSLEGGDDGAVVWTAPEEPGAYQITLVVSDGLARLGQRLGLTVGE